MTVPPPAPPERPEDPFAPPSPAGWRRVSPRLRTARRVLLLGPGGAVLLAASVAAALLDPRAGAGLAAAGVLALGAGWLWVDRSWRSWGYAERAEDLLVVRGVLLRRLTVVPYGRLQFVDVIAGPLDRALGLARVRLHTASAATDAWVPGLDAAEAARLRDRLAALGESRAAGL